MQIVFIQSLMHGFIVFINSHNCKIIPFSLLIIRALTVVITVITVYGDLSGMKISKGERGKIQALILQQAYTTHFLPPTQLATYWPPPLFPPSLRTWNMMPLKLHNRTLLPPRETVWANGGWRWFPRADSSLLLFLPFFSSSSPSAPSLPLL